jgi:hypothetical protein
MHPRLRELQEYLDRQHANLQEAIVSIDPAHRGMRPGTDRWSVDEVVAHLAIIEERIARMLGGAAAKARSEGVGPDQSSESFLSSWSDAKILDRSRKIRNPRGDPPQDMADPYASFEASRTAFGEMLKAADGVDLSKVSAPHPAFGDMNGYEWIAFTAAHRGRHADQIREIGREIPR